MLYGEVPADVQAAMDEMKSPEYREALKLDRTARRLMELDASGEAMMDQFRLQQWEAQVWANTPDVLDIVTVHAGYTSVKACGKRFNEGNLMGTRIEAQAVPRSPITTFSPKSKGNLTKTMLDLEKLTPLFLTLTYPSVFPTPRKAKIHLDTLFKRIKRRYPFAFGIWKQEPQARGAVHFHILLDLGPGMAQLHDFGHRTEIRTNGGKMDEITQGWIARTWYEIVGSGDEKHLRRGTDLRDLRTESDAQTKKIIMSYVSKYMGKMVFTDAEMQTAWATPGRWWGVFNREAYRAACKPVQEYTISDGDSAKLRRALRKLIRSRGGKRYAKRCARFGSWYSIIEDHTVHSLLAHIKGVGGSKAPGRGAVWGSPENKPRGPSAPSNDLLRWLYDRPSKWDPPHPDSPFQ